MTSAPSHKLWYLNQFELFAELSEPDIDALAGIMNQKTFPKGDAIYFPGDPAKTIYLLIKGRVRITQISDEGKEAILAILAPGDIFGELALLDDEGVRNEIVEAMEDCLICYIAKSDFEGFLIQKPALNLKVTKFIGLRLRRIENQIYNLIFKDAFSRLESLLERLAEDYGEPHPEGVLITIKLTHQDLGNLINATRPTVSEYLAELKKQGRIQTLGHKIVWCKKP